MTEPTPATLDRYLSGEYAAENPDWHEDDSEWKTGHIVRILEGRNVVPATICEIGCGGGKIVELMSARYRDAQVYGFEISPQAFARCLTRETANLHFENGSPFGQDKRYDLTMAIDVIEHVEDPFSFARSMGAISDWQVFHIPLDMNALAVARGWVLPDARKKIGHLSYFMKDTALAMLEECGLDVVDHFYTPWAIDQSYKTLKKRIAAWPRRIAFASAPDLTVRTVGGWSLMVLTKTRI